MDTERCADFAVAHAVFSHSENINPELLFIWVSQISFG
jgi:hypothetical protein